MKTVQEYREQWAQRKGYTNWNDVIVSAGSYGALMTGIVDEFSKFYAKEVAKVALKNASENALLTYKHPFAILPEYVKSYQINENMQGGGINFLINVSEYSITNKNNIPKL